MESVRECLRCKTSLPLNDEYFAYKQNGDLTLRCIPCLQRDGSPLCIHKRFVGTCTDCGDKRCDHGFKTYCKLCNDPKVVTAANIVRNSKNSDIEKGRFDAEKFIDFDHVMELIKNSKDRCYYCKCKLHYMGKAYGETNMASIERLTNAVGHNKGNCVISCLECNLVHIGEIPVRRKRGPSKKRKAETEPEAKPQRKSFYDMLVEYNATTTDPLPIPISIKKNN